MACLKVRDVKSFVQHNIKVVVMTNGCMWFLTSLTFNVA